MLFSKICDSLEIMLVCIWHGCRNICGLVLVFLVGLSKPFVSVRGLSVRLLVLLGWRIRRTRWLSFRSRSVSKKWTDGSNTNDTNTSSILTYTTHLSSYKYIRPIQHYDHKTTTTSNKPVDNLTYKPAHNLAYNKSVVHKWSHILSLSFQKRQQLILANKPILILVNSLNNLMIWIFIIPYFL